MTKKVPKKPASKAIGWRTERVASTEVVTLRVARRTTTSDAPLQVTEHRANGATWNSPSFVRRRVELRGSGREPVKHIDDARLVVIWLEDGTEIHVELFERVTNMLDIRCNPDALVVCPAASNRILVGGKREP